jgi:hypothetical protein
MAQLALLLARAGDRHERGTIIHLANLKLFHFPWAGMNFTHAHALTSSHVDSLFYFYVRVVRTHNNGAIYPIIYVHDDAIELF